MGEIENESPVPAIEDHIEMVRNVQVHSKPAPEAEINHLTEDDYDVEAEKFDSDEDVGDIENEEIGEEEIQPTYDTKKEMFTSERVEKQEEEEVFILKKDTITESKQTR